MITWGKYNSKDGDVFTIFCTTCRKKLKKNAPVSKLRLMCDKLEKKHNCTQGISMETREFISEIADCM